MGSQFRYYELPSGPVTTSYHTKGPQLPYPCSPVRPNSAFTTIPLESGPQEKSEALLVHQSKPLGLTRTVIGGQKPVEFDCSGCDTRIITHTKCVYEARLSCAQICILVAATISTVILGFGLISGVENGDVKAFAIYGLLMVGAMLVWAAVVVKGKCSGGSAKKGEWRVYHYCPGCNKLLANVPGDAPNDLKDEFGFTL